MSKKQINVEDMFRLSQSFPNSLPEYGTNLTGHSADDVLNGKDMTENAKRMIEIFKPILVNAAIPNNMNASDEQKRRHGGTYVMAMLAALSETFKTPINRWVRESTQAGTDVPTFTRQVIAVIQRAYPRMLAPMLFQVTPMTGPTARIYFETTKYNTAYSSTAPTIADGDSLADLTKFNKNYAQKDQGLTANQIKHALASIDISAVSYRVYSEWTYEAADDMASQFGGSLESRLINKMADLLAWTTDRTMIDAMTSDVNSTQTWTAQPSGYSSLAPSEKKAYDESIWADGILPLITKIQLKRAFNTYPTFMLAGSTIAERFQKLTTFVPAGRAPDMSFELGAVRYVGNLGSLGIAIYVDPQLTADVAYLGAKPTSSDQPSIHYCPYRPIGYSNQLEYPQTGTFVRGAYTRFAIARKSSDSSDPSSQLGDVYGRLTVI